jgi:glyoxylase-like metal-dependent hydrolase (beta-lactamase superfamily II)
MLRIGPYRISSVETGRFALDGGAMFGIVPKTMWEKTNPADEQNRIDMRLRAMLIRKDADAAGPARNILVDCGIGTKWAERYRAIYKIDHSRSSLAGGLAAHGLKPDDITDLILTHLHFDHAGGLTSRAREDDPASELVPTFPNAKVYLQRRNWELAWSPSEKDRASYLAENYAPYAPGKGDPQWARRLELLDTPAIEPSGRTAFAGADPREEAILPGITVQISHGHTLGMQLVRVSDGSGAPGTSIVYCADLIPTATHVRVPFIMAYDCYPMFLLDEKKKLLNRTADEGGYLFYEHCPRMAASGVLRDAKGDFQHDQPVAL